MKEGFQFFIHLLCSHGSLKPSEMAALWQWRFEFEEYPERWFDPEDYCGQTDTYCLMDEAALHYYGIMPRLPKSRVYLEKFHFIRYLELPVAYFSVSMKSTTESSSSPSKVVLRPAKTPAARKCFIEEFAKEFISDLLAMEATTPLCKMPEEYSIDLPYGFGKYWKLRKEYRDKFQSGKAIYEEDRPHPAFGWRGLLWKMHRHRKLKSIWSSLGNQLKEMKSDLDVASLSKEISIPLREYPESPPLDESVRDYRSKRALLEKDNEHLFKMDNGLWNISPTMPREESFAAKQLWLRSQTPVTRSNSIQKVRRDAESLRESSERRLAVWKQLAEEKFGEDLDRE